MTSMPPRDEYRPDGVFEYFLRDAAQQEAADLSTTVRAHDDQVG